jgi:hypothetical protein
VAAPIDSAVIPQQISLSFDAHRQSAYELFPKGGKGPLAFFKSQSDTVPFVASLMERAYGLGANPAIPHLKAAGAPEAFPSARLFQFMALHAPQI